MIIFIRGGYKIAIFAKKQQMHDWSADVNALFSIGGLIELVTLSVLEIILGIDNIIFISIAVNKLPKAQQP